jgi:hypothetical protein
MCYLHYKIKCPDPAVSRICDDELWSKTYKIRSPVRYFPVYILIKETKIRTVTDLPSDRLAGFIASVPETNQITERSLSLHAQGKRYRLLASATTILSSFTRCPIILVC